MEKKRKYLIFLVTAVLSLTAFFVTAIVTDSKFGKILSFVIPLAVIAVSAAIYTAELRAIKKNEAIKRSVGNGEFFSSQSWRQAYLNFRTQYEFANIHPRGMRADMLRNYRNLPTYLYFLFFFTVAVVFACILMPHPIEKMTKFRFMMLLGGILCSCDGIRRLAGIPARRWMKRIKAEYSDVEASYNSGRLVKSWTSGINIGTDYIVIFNPSRVVSFRTADIVEAGRKVVRENWYNTGIYVQTDQKYKVYFVVGHSKKVQRTYEVELNVFESELVCDEVRELLDRRSELPVSYEETVREDVTTI
ncbi:hypothetical protein [Ruminococcus flavefaciens]|uniref:Uncharacterized protein n=1 Tax=Ruminococcus flavefaciens 007c TaxID=1341157 RepID=W7V2X8_RUMFL|nr:hypothetical protein [Ruminococcus flavefaciens]EWM55112.1 hypothetical protein RF007C_05415 [Ruminococcus flavefaciens 007c]